MNVLSQKSEKPQVSGNTSAPLDKSWRLNARHSGELQGTLSLLRGPCKFQKRMVPDAIVIIGLRCKFPLSNFIFRIL